MTQNFVQLSIFDEEVQIKTPQELAREKYLGKAQSKEGFWIIICRQLLFVNEQGEFEDYPDKAYIPKYFTVSNTRGRRSSYYSKKKKFTNLKEAVSDVQTKMIKQKPNAHYVIMAQLSTTEEDYAIRNSRTCGQSIMGVRKSPDGLIYELHSNVESGYSFRSILSNDDITELKKYNVLPNSWIKERKKRNTTLNQLEEELKSNNNVKEVIFKSPMSSKMKENYIRMLIGLYDILKRVFDVYSTSPVNIVIGDIRGNKNATYSPDTKTLSLHKSCLDSFFHEYRHHIEYTIGRKQHYFTFESPEQTLVQTLTKEKTISKFIKEYEERFKIFKEIEKPNSTDKYNYERSCNFFYYYKSHAEINARFFEDYFNLNYKDELNKLASENGLYYSDSLSFSEEEVKKYGYLLEELIVLLNQPRETLVAEYKDYWKKNNN